MVGDPKLTQTVKSTAMSKAQNSVVNRKSDIGMMYRMSKAGFGSIANMAMFQSQLRNSSIKNNHQEYNSEQGALDFELEMGSIKS